MQVHGGPIMTSWRFEGSNDLKNWETLDARYGHLHSQDAINAIKNPGSTTTWGIANPGCSGFSAFRLVQIDQNTG